MNMHYFSFISDYRNVRFLFLNTLSFYLLTFIVEPVVLQVFIFNMVLSYVVIKSIFKVYLKDVFVVIMC